MIKFDVNKSALKEVRDNFRKVSSDISRMENPHGKIAAFLDRWVQKNFKTEGKHVGGWEPFAYGGRLVKKKKANAQDVVSKKYINTSAKLLQHTGRLRLSMIPFYNRRNAGIGSELHYSKHHEQGGKKGNPPQRRMLPVIGEVQKDITDIYINFVETSIKVLK